IEVPAFAPPPDSKPTNFLSLSRGNGAIKGTYVIDPRLTIPPFLLPPLASDETESTRRNVHLHTSNGAIDVDLFVVGANDAKRRVDVLLKSSNGAITARLHAPTTARPPIHLRAHTSNGAITVHLPRAFRGPLTVRTRHGSVRFSDALTADLTTLGEADGTHRCFVGTWGEAGEWAGDKIDVETSNGSVKFAYDAEPRGGDGKEKGKGSFFGRFLGL
ncbi:hypothetical protein C8R44DRAFT_622750, partial [Mycena epipterygia]